jgi:hypothetical protein
MAVCSEQDHEDMDVEANINRDTEWPQIIYAETCLCIPTKETGNNYYWGTGEKPAESTICLPQERCNTNARTIEDVCVGPSVDIQLVRSGDWLFEVEMTFRFLADHYWPNNQVSMFGFPDEYIVDEAHVTSSTANIMQMPTNAQTRQKSIPGCFHCIVPPDHRCIPDDANWNEANCSGESNVGNTCSEDGTWDTNIGAHTDPNLNILKCSRCSNCENEEEKPSTQTPHETQSKSIFTMTVSGIKMQNDTLSNNPFNTTNPYDLSDSTDFFIKILKSQTLKIAHPIHVYLSILVLN